MDGGDKAMDGGADAVITLKQFSSSVILRRHFDTTKPERRMSAIVANITHA